MPKPRADFYCKTCNEGHENLPVTATVCPDPECGGELERLWNQAPGVISDGTKTVDRVVGPEYLRQTANRPHVPVNQSSQRQSAAAAFGMLGPEARLWSQISGAGTIGAIKQVGGPRPVYARPQS
jgi:hypothetical protein